MDDVFRIQALDSLNSRKIHELTRTERDTNEFLQGIKLLPKTSRATDECRKKCNDWKLQTRSKAADGEKFFS